jgi:hypothetical protein
MAQMTIHLRCDPRTGKKELLVSMRPEGDLLPLESEQQQRAFLEALLGSELWNAGIEGRIVITRAAEAVAAEDPDCGVLERARPPISEGAQASG